jgi:hypothetical protein
MSEPRSHVPGRDFLAIIRGQRPEPPRPYTFDAVGVTSSEYDELLTVPDKSRTGMYDRMTCPTCGDLLSDGDTNVLEAEHGAQLRHRACPGAAA